MSYFYFPEVRIEVINTFKLSLSKNIFEELKFGGKFQDIDEFYCRKRGVSG